MEIRFTDPENKDFIYLTGKLDEYYFELVGDVHKRYAPFNVPSKFHTRVVIYDGETAAACGCWKKVDDATVEIKRIYVLPEYRRQGLASKVVTTLEEDAKKNGFTRFILETARTTMDSAALYFSLGYREIENYGSPAGADFSRCFEKFAE